MGGILYYLYTDHSKRASKVGHDSSQALESQSVNSTCLKVMLEKLCSMVRLGKALEARVVRVTPLVPTPVVEKGIYALTGESMAAWVDDETFKNAG